MARTLVQVHAGGVILISTASLNPHPPCIEQWQELCVDTHSYDYWDNSGENIGVVGAYHNLWMTNRQRYLGNSCPNREDILCLIHDDCTLHERGWDRRVAREFDDPQVAIVGLGGATGIGTDDIYLKPYRIEQLIRIGYRSNQDDWATHGVQEKGACDVAVVDGFFMAVRRSFLDKIGGFSGFPHRFHMYDAYLCLQALRHGYKVRMVGVACHHRGGGSSTRPEYKADCEARGTTMEREHQEPHCFIYDHFADMLPYRI